MNFHKLLLNFAGEVIFLHNHLGFTPIEVIRTLDNAVYRTVPGCNTAYGCYYWNLSDAITAANMNGKEIRHVYLLAETGEFAPKKNSVLNDVSNEHLDQFVEENEMVHYIHDQFIPFSKRMASFDPVI